MQGWDEIINNVYYLADSREIDAINKKLIEEATVEAEKVIKDKFNRSKDNSKSGIKNYRPSGHFVDNIPKSKIRKNRSGMSRTIGETEKNGDYFYTQFPEFGTSKQPPVHAFADAREAAQNILDNGIGEYNKLLQEKLDGK